MARFLHVYVHVRFKSLVSGMENCEQLFSSRSQEESDHRKIRKMPNVSHTLFYFLCTELKYSVLITGIVL